MCLDFAYEAAKHSESRKFEENNATTPVNILVQNVARSRGAAPEICQTQGSSSTLTRIITLLRGSVLHFRIFCRHMDFIFLLTRLGSMTLTEQVQCTINIKINMINMGWQFDSETKYLHIRP